MADLILSGSTSGTVTVSAPAVSGSSVLTLPVATDTLVGKATTDTLTNKTLTAPVLSGSVTGTYTMAGTPTMGASVLTSGTAQSYPFSVPAAVDFTGIPSWVKRITVMFNGVSTNATSLIQVQIGDSGGIETTSYSSGAWTSNVTNANATTGFIIHGTNAAASRVWDGAYTIVLMDTSNTWVFTGMCNSLNDNAQSIGIGRKQVSATLDRVRITTVNGTDTFDAGSINLLYE